MEVSEEVLKRVCANARIDFDEKFLEDLKAVLEAFSVISEARVDNILPSFHAFPIVNVFREDKEQEGLDHAKALLNSAHKSEGYFRGPEV